MHILFAFATLVQAPPSTDIYLADLRLRGGRVSVGTPVNVTARTGYDNQPYFLPDGRSFFYTSVREDAQADIYRYDVRRRTTTRVTATSESEYSATPLPGGRGFSVVRVEPDSTQRLWAFDLDGSHPRIVLQEIKPVGYHAWGDDHTLGLFVLGSPATLQLADTRSGSATVEARDIGRSIHKVPGRAAISFVQRDSAAAWWVKEVDLRTRQIRPLVKTRERVDLYAWTPSGLLLMAQGSKLYQWDPQRGGELQAVADLATAGLNNITRLAVSPRGDRIAIVATDAPAAPPSSPPDL